MIMRSRILDAEYYTDIPTRILLEQTLDKSINLTDFKKNIREEAIKAIAHSRDLISDICE
jgi:hypothetical protein